MKTVTRCIAKTTAGAHCNNFSSPDSAYCHHYRPGTTAETPSSEGLCFKDALYYPFIEISDETWIKTACLYWDTISTIVPTGMEAHRSGVAKVLREANILRSLFVDPDMRELQAVAEEVLLYLDSPEGQQLLSYTGATRSSKLHVHKFSEELRGALIHNRKLSRRLHLELQQLGLRRRDRGPWLHLPASFGAYYMTILATHLARAHGKSLLTEAVAAERLASRAALGDSLSFLGPAQRIPGRLAEGLLATMVLRAVNIGPGTATDKILRFREKHENEVGRFRTAIREFVDSLNSDVQPEALSAYVATIYKDRVVPALHDLRGRLRDSRITCGFNNLKLSTLVSASPTVLGVALAGTPFGPFALAAGVGLSVVLATANYRVQRREILRNSPFSYVIAAERQFGRPKQRLR